MFLCVSGSNAATPEEDALAVLTAQLRQDPRYRVECLSFMPESAQGGVVIFALREKHNAECGGDPELAPVVDRYRVSLSAKQIELYDALEDEFKPYSTRKTPEDK